MLLNPYLGRHLKFNTMKRLLPFLLLILFAAGLEAQHNKVIDRIIELGQTDNRTMQHVDVRQIVSEDA